MTKKKTTNDTPEPGAATADATIDVTAATTAAELEDLEPTIDRPFGHLTIDERVAHLSARVDWSTRQIAKLKETK